MFDLALRRKVALIFTFTFMMFKETSGFDFTFPFKMFKETIGF